MTAALQSFGGPVTPGTTCIQAPGTMFATGQPVLSHFPNMAKFLGKMHVTFAPQPPLVSYLPSSMSEWAGKWLWTQQLPPLVNPPSSTDPLNFAAMAGQPAQ